MPKRWQNLNSQLLKQVTLQAPKQGFDDYLCKQDLVDYHNQWQALNQVSFRTHEAYEFAISEWLIALFNQLFRHHNTVLVRASTVKDVDEPEYFPATEATPAQIAFAHGYFASCLHEISHWTIAGKYRRTLNDFGYWYAPDGRSETQQAEFEQVEIKPQAIECLLTLACRRKFMVSQDNLFADFDTSQSTFAQDVFALASDYLDGHKQLPVDAQLLLLVLFEVCGDSHHSRC